MCRIIIEVSSAFIVLLKLVVNVINEGPTRFNVHTKGFVLEGRQISPSPARVHINKPILAVLIYYPTCPCAARGKVIVCRPSSTHPSSSLET